MYWPITFTCIVSVARCMIYNFYIFLMIFACTSAMGAHCIRDFHSCQQWTLTSVTTVRTAPQQSNTISPTPQSLLPFDDVHVLKLELSGDHSSVTLHFVRHDRLPWPWLGRHHQSGTRPANDICIMLHATGIMPSFNAATIWTWNLPIPPMSSNRLSMML